MHMSGESLLVVLVVGLIAGWLAGQIVQGTGFGIVGDLLIGIAGAFIGSWLLPQLGLHRLGHCPGGHQRHHRRVVIAVGHQARSWRRRVARELEETLVAVRLRPHRWRERSRRRREGMTALPHLSNHVPRAAARL